MTGLGLSCVYVFANQEIWHKAQTNFKVSPANKEYNLGGYTPVCEGMQLLFTEGSLLNNDEYLLSPRMFPAAGVANELVQDMLAGCSTPKD